MWIIWLLFAFVALVENQVEMIFVMLAFAAISGIIGKVRKSDRRIAYLDSLEYSVGEKVHHNKMDTIDNIGDGEYTMNGIILEVKDSDTYYVEFTTDSYNREFEHHIKKIMHKRGLEKGWRIG